MRTLILGLALGSAVALGGLGSGTTTASGATSPGTGKSGGSGPARVDPRAGGFELDLGEWALVPEAKAIRPGDVTFVIRNRGKFVHGFEIEITRRGGGDDDRLKAESMELRPGQATRLTLSLPPGVYDIECSVGDHDNLGMRGVLEVRRDAPLVAVPRAGRPSTVAISGFVFKPATLKTTVGATATWRNDDAAPHTVTGKGLSSRQLGRGDTFRQRFTRAGTFAYVCALHPGMRGKVVVASRSTS